MFLTKITSFISTEWKKITGDAAAVEVTLESIATVANNAVNVLKTWALSPAGKDIEALISAVPGIGPYVTDVLNFLPTLVVDLGWAKAEFTKSPAQVVQDGITAAINVANPNVKATNLAVLSAHVSTYIAGLAQTPMSIQSALSVAPAVYATPPTPAANVITN